jgi:acid stress-induced BolA-like protein IbaG/YrbA
MPITVEALENLFPRDDLGNKSEFEFDEQIEKFTGHVISREFQGVAVPARQGLVWDRIREAFGDESQRISLVLTFTPEEWEEVGDDPLREAI